MLNLSKMYCVILCGTRNFLNEYVNIVVYSILIHSFLHVLAPCMSLLEFVYWFEHSSQATQLNGRMRCLLTVLISKANFWAVLSQFLKKRRRILKVCLETLLFGLSMSFRYKLTCLTLNRIRNTLVIWNLKFLFLYH